MPDLDFEKITLNAIPDGDMPVFHASQFETMRPFKADLKWGSEDFAPGEGNWCTLSIRKNDDTLVIIDDIDIDNNTVSCILTQQSVACMGDNFCQLKVWGTEGDEDGCIACLNFILHVQPDPEAGGITSESEINNLTQQVEEITQQVIGDDYYNKTEVDDLLDDKADKATTYTKSEVDTALNFKADKATTYTKTQVDSALALKADKSDTYTKTQVDNALALKANTDDLATVATTGDYDDLINKPSIPAAQVQSDYAQADNTQVDYIKNKPDIDLMIANAIIAVMPVDIAGPSAIANFNTELAVDLVDCKTTVPPSLDGYSAVNLTACGANIWGSETMADAFANEAGYSKNTTTKTFTFKNAPASPYNDIIYDKFKPSTQYTLIFRYTADAINNSLRIDYTDETSTEIYLSAVNDKTDYIVTTTSGKSVKSISLHYYGNGTVTVYYDESGLFEGVKTVADFTPYTGNAYTIAFGQTVYGGMLDVTTGVLTVEYDSSLQPITPYDVQLTPTAVTARVGENNVYSDTGDTTVQYKDSIQHYIDQRT